MEKCLTFYIEENRLIRGRFQFFFCNYFISEKYNRVQSFKLHFLQNTSLVQIYSSASDCESVGNIPGNHILKKTFQLFRRILYYGSSITIAPSPQCWIQSREQVNICWSHVRGCSKVVTLFFVNKSVTKTDRCAGALSWGRNQLLVLHFSGHFLLTASPRQRRMPCTFLYSQ